MFIDFIQLKCVSFINRFIKKQGMDQNFYECDNHLWRLGTRELPSGIRYDGGSDWICLDRKFSEYAIFGSDPLLEGLKQLFNYTLLPVEVRSFNPSRTINP